MQTCTQAAMTEVSSECVTARGPVRDRRGGACSGDLYWARAARRPACRQLPSSVSAERSSSGRVSEREAGSLATGTGSDKQSSDESRREALRTVATRSSSENTALLATRDADDLQSHRPRPFRLFRSRSPPRSLAISPRSTFFLHPPFLHVRSPSTLDRR